MKIVAGQLMVLWITIQSYDTEGYTRNVDCKSDVIGYNYIGKQNRVFLGKLPFTCQMWSVPMPHAHKYTDASHFPDRHMENVSNYCRNPSRKKKGPWCFTTGYKRWAYCDIPLCDDHVAIVPVAVASSFILVGVLVVLMGVWYMKPQKTEPSLQVGSVLTDDLPTQAVKKLRENHSTVEDEETASLDLILDANRDYEKDVSEFKKMCEEAPVTRTLSSNRSPAHGRSSLRPSDDIPQITLAEQIAQARKAGDLTEDEKTEQQYQLQQTYLVLLKSLLDANSSMDVVEIQRCLAAYESIGVVFEIDQNVIRQSREFLFVGKCRTDLYMAIREGDLSIINHVIRSVKTRGLKERLWLELRVAKRVSQALKRTKKSTKLVLRMDRAILSQVREYNPPPPVVHDVMMAVLLVLGEPEHLSSDWTTCQFMSDTVGARQYLGLYTRIKDFHVKNLHPEVAQRALTRLSPYRRKGIDKLSKGVGVLYSWAKNVSKCAISLVHFTSKEATGDRQERNITDIRVDADLRIIKEDRHLDETTEGESDSFSDSLLNDDDKYVSVADSTSIHGQDKSNQNLNETEMSSRQDTSKQSADAVVKKSTLDVV